MSLLDNLQLLNSDLRQSEVLQDRAEDQPDEGLAEFIGLWKKLKENASKRKSQITDSILKAQAFKD